MPQAFIYITQFPKKKKGFSLDNKFRLMASVFFISLTFLRVLCCVKNFSAWAFLRPGVSRVFCSSKYKIIHISRRWKQQTGFQKPNNFSFHDKSKKKKTFQFSLLAFNFQCNFSTTERKSLNIKLISHCLNVNSARTQKSFSLRMFVYAHNPV